LQPQPQPPQQKSTSTVGSVSAATLAAREREKAYIRAHMLKAARGGK
jgi:hypothetical protein